MLFLASSHDDDELTAWFCFLEMGYHLGKGSPNTLFVNFANLTTATHLTIISKDFCELLQRFKYPVWRLVEHHRSRLFAKTLKACLTTFLLWQETLETETVIGKSATHKRWYQGCGTREALHFDARCYRLAYEEKTRITDAWSASVADECNGFSRLKTLYNCLRGTMFVELMVRLQVVVYVVVLQELT